MWAICHHVVWSGFILFSEWDAQFTQLPLPLATTSTPQLHIPTLVLDSRQRDRWSPCSTSGIPLLVFLLYILTLPLTPHEPFLKAAGRDKALELRCETSDEQQLRMGLDSEIFFSFSSYRHLYPFSSLLTLCFPHWHLSLSFLLTPHRLLSPAYVSQSPAVSNSCSSIFWRWPKRRKKR